MKTLNTESMQISTFLYSTIYGCSNQPSNKDARSFMLQRIADVTVSFDAINVLVMDNILALFRTEFCFEMDHFLRE